MPRHELLQYSDKKRCDDRLENRNTAILLLETRLIFYSFYPK